MQTKPVLDIWENGSNSPIADAWFDLLIVFAWAFVFAGLAVGCSDDAQPARYLIREEVDYPWKHCVYQDLVSEYVTTIEAFKACPQLIP